MSAPDINQVADQPLPLRKLIICATPRSASTTLIALLNVAGIGICGEYFCTTPSGDFIRDFDLGDPRQPGFPIATYLDRLMRSRQRNGTFSVKVFFSHMAEQLLNPTGRDLFHDARVVYLFRTDPGAQAVSIKVALQTDEWMDKPVDRDRELPEKAGTAGLPYFINSLATENMNWRKFFAYAGIDPLTITDEDVAQRPFETVQAIADLLGVDFDRKAVAAVAAKSAKYSVNADRKKSMIQQELAGLKAKAFRPETYADPLIPRKTNLLSRFKRLVWRVIDRF